MNEIASPDRTRPAPRRVVLGPVAALHRPGRGPALVMLHGIGSAADSFRPLFDQLPAASDPSPDLWAWDMPGYGGSAPLEPDWPTAGDYATSLAAFLDAAGIRRCALLGHSLGTIVATRFARRHPDRVTALALLSPALGHGIAPGSALPPSVQARLDDLDTLGAATMAARRAPRLLAAPDGPALAAVRDAMARVARPGYAQASRMLAASDLLADVAGLAVPTRILVGAEDAVTPPANAARLADALRPAGRLAGLHIVPGAGHALPQERPAETASLLADLVA